MDLSLRVVDVWKKYGTQSVLKDVSVDAHSGECLGLLGRNGTGKTTLGRIIAGLEAPDKGRVELPAGGRALLVQQDFVVWPHLSARANVELGLSKDAMRENPNTTQRWMSCLELIDCSEKKAGELSHGQQQRVALARALVHRPAVMVLDEVFSNLDIASRAPLIEAIRAYKQESETALIWIGHEWRVMTELCDRIAVISDGVVVQTASPETIYQKPAAEHIAHLGGALNAFSTEQWEVLGRFSSGGWPNPGGSRVAVRPEDWTVEKNVEGAQVTCLTSAHWAPGYVHTLNIENKVVVKVWSDQRMPKMFRGHLHLREDACIHAW